MSVPIINIPIQTSSCAAFIKEGDTIEKITLTFSDGWDGDFTTSTIKMQLYKNSIKYLDISNGSGITVVSSSVFEIDQIDATDNNFPAGVLIGDLEVTDENGIRLTYFNVQYTIVKQYTK